MQEYVSRFCDVLESSFAESPDSAEQSRDPVIFPFAFSHPPARKKEKLIAKPSRFLDDDLAGLCKVLSLPDGSGSISSLALREDSIRPADLYSKVLSDERHVRVAAERYPTLPFFGELLKGSRVDVLNSAEVLALAAINGVAHEAKSFLGKHSLHFTMYYLLTAVPQWCVPTCLVHWVGARVVVSAGPLGLRPGDPISICFDKELGNDPNKRNNHHKKQRGCGCKCPACKPRDHRDPLLDGLVARKVFHQKEAAELRQLMLKEIEPTIHAEVLRVHLHLPHDDLLLEWLPQIWRSHLRIAIRQGDPSQEALAHSLTDDVLAHTLKNTLNPITTAPSSCRSLSSFSWCKLSSEFCESWRRLALAFVEHTDHSPPRGAARGSLKWVEWSERRHKLDLMGVATLLLSSGTSSSQPGVWLFVDHFGALMKPILRFFLRREAIADSQPRWMFDCTIRQQIAHIARLIRSPSDHFVHEPEDKFAPSLASHFFVDLALCPLIQMIVIALKTLNP